ncbi:MAG: hypothetical protein NPIRA03_19460 [Nitrospirales bacterium]|nr:MAG: hypothetical protein NPIRA03_19460 [Nitrospirales bacterium]
MYTRVLLFVMLSLPSLFLSTSQAQEQSTPYDYPNISPYAATVIGTPPELRAVLPDKIPVDDRELSVFPDRTLPDILWYGENMRYSLVPQEQAAPLIFVIAGTGAGYNSEKMQVLQRAFFQAGFHVLSLSSPTHPDFIVSASRTGIPGHLLEDSQDLYRVMRLVWLDIQHEIEVTEFYLTGYSLGAAQAAFVSQLDEEQEDFHFTKVLLINPPVSLYTSTSILDDMLANNIPGGTDQFPDFFDRVFHAFSEEYQHGEFVNFSGDFLYSAYKNRQPSEGTLAALIGTSFRIASSNMVFTADVLTNSGYIKPKNLVLSATDSVTDYFKVSNRVTFLDYFREMFYPFFQARYPGLTEQGLIANLSLATLEDYLSHAPKVGLLHNADDIILGDGELDYLKKVFGPRAKIYPRGGHCGNLDHRATLGYIVDFFRNPLPANLAQHPGQMLPTPTPMTPSYPTHQTTGPEEFPTSPFLQRISYRPSLDFQYQLDRQIQDLERKLQESHAYLQATQVRETASEIIPDPVHPEDTPTAPDAEDEIIEPAKRSVKDVVQSDVRYLVDVYDPIEGFNRGVYKFNAQFDEYVFLPVVEGYEAVMPDFFEERVSDFFSNLADIRNLFNAMLQLNGEATLNTLGRFLINCTFGLGGFFDHATPLGIPQQTEDFGQTLGHYGLNPGAYLVLPILGPSSLRDTAGLLTDYTASFFYLYTPLHFNNRLERSSPFTLTWSVNTRQQLNFRYYQTGSPFEYDLIRFLYTKKRELDIAK